MGTNRDEMTDAIALTPRESRLLPLLFGARLTEADMRILTDGMDVDCENHNYLLMLACLGYEQGWELFPQEIVPRLKGLHRYHQVSNAIRLPWLAENIRLLREADIPVMLIKGLALRLYYAVGVPRLMSDYDIAVPEDRYAEAMDRLKRGNVVCKDLTSPHHGQVVSPYRTLELHRWIFKHHGESSTDIWERAVHFQFQGMDVCVPCPEDMFIHQLDNRARDIITYTFPARRMQWLCDCRRILEKGGGIDLSSLAARAREFNVALSVRYMLPYFAECFPESVPQAEIDRVLPDSAQYRRWRRLGSAYRSCSARYISYHYTVTSAFTPRRVCRSLWVKWRRYRVFRCERGASYSLGQFFQETFMVDNLGELFAKYRGRLHLFERKGAS